MKEWRKNIGAGLKKKIYISFGSVKGRGNLLSNLSELKWVIYKTSRGKSLGKAHFSPQKYNIIAI